MQQKYEYKFVRLGEGWVAVREAGKQSYQETVHKHARDGWRLVQVFAPVIYPNGAAKYFELIFEREVER
jgi:hypothetical protein